MDLPVRVGRTALIGIVAIGLAACGDEEEAGTAQAAEAPNRAPLISGVLQPVAYEDELYEFVPRASDPDGDPIVFSIEGKPAWAEFDSKTGKFSGTPGKADRGKHRGIVISVSDGEAETPLPTTDVDVVPEPVDNTAPAISGAPAGSVTAGDFYDFIPVASDADGDALSFTIQNQPVWAEFDPQIGRLFGTPATGDVGSYGNIVIGVRDGIATTSLDPFVIVVNPPPSQNAAPTIGGTPPTSVLVGNAYSFTPVASDADGDVLSFSVISLPAWAQFDQATGAIRGTPGPGQAGTYSGISIVVSDGQEQAALTSFSIEVISPNRAPTIGGTPASSVEAGSTYGFVPTASDPDGDALTFSIAGLPSWASFDPASGALSGTPASGQVGSYDNISITASDAEDSAMLGPFSIEVTAPNRAPTIGGTPPAGVTVGDLYAFVPVASDADGDALSFTILNRPAWAQFDPQTGRLFGTPGTGDVGSYGNIVIEVSDGDATTALAPFTVVVNPLPPQNTPPTISGTPASSVLAGDSYAFTPTASDPDGDTLTFSIAGLPSWASFNTSNGALTGRPGSARVGTYGNISITVSDGAASATLASFSIEVVANNAPPTISGTPASSVLAGDSYAFTPTASDPDGDSLSYSVSGLPSWASFDPTRGTLAGAPDAGHVGTYSNISITVSDGAASATLGPFSIEVLPIALGTATLTWTPPTQNADGSALTDLAGYIVYWGTVSGNYSNSVTLSNPGLTSYVVDNLLPGTTYYFATTAFDSDGTESTYSNEASKTFP